MSNHPFAKCFRSLNRKERFYVANLIYGETGCSMGDSTLALNFPSGDSVCSLNSSLVSRVAEMVGIVGEPNIIAHGIDYHLDWIDAAIQIVQSGKDCNSYFGSKGDRLSFQNGLSGNLDSDIVFVYETQAGIDIVFIEVKAYGSWDAPQMNKKLDRLRQIFGSDGKKHQGFRPHLICIDLLERNGPQTIPDGIDWPFWDGKQIPERLHFHECNFNKSYMLEKRGIDHYGLK